MNLLKSLNLEHDDGADRCWSLDHLEQSCIRYMFLGDLIRGGSDCRDCLDWAFTLMAAIDASFTSKHYDRARVATFNLGKFGNCDAEHSLDEFNDVLLPVRAFEQELRDLDRSVHDDLIDLATVIVEQVGGSIESWKAERHCMVPEPEYSGTYAA